MKLIFEQWGRISITAITMYGIYNFHMDKIPEFFAMVSVLIWMILPSIELIKGVKK